MAKLPFYLLSMVVFVFLAPTVTQGQVTAQQLPVYSNNPRLVPSAQEFHGASETFVRRSGKSCAACHIDSNYPQGDFFGAEAITRPRLFWICATLSLMIFAGGLLRNISIWRLGEGPSLHKRIRWPIVWRAMVSSVLFEKKILRMSTWRWFNFFAISICFVALFLVFLLSVTVRNLFQLTFFLEGAGSALLDFSMDFLGAIVLIGTVSALIRRYVYKPEGLVNSPEDFWILVLLFAIISSGFVLEAFRLAALPWYPEMRYSVVGNSLANVIRTEGSPWLSWHFYLWLLHGVLALIFIAAMPFTKIMHFITAPLTIVSAASDEPMHEFRPKKTKHESVMST
jgi:nitrate reductase gamma subunit